MSTADELRKLRELFDDGTITWDEFDRGKEKILAADVPGGGAASPPASEKPWWTDFSGEGGSVKTVGGGGAVNSSASSSSSWDVFESEKGRAFNNEGFNTSASSGQRIYPSPVPEPEKKKKPVGCIILVSFFLMFCGSLLYAMQIDTNQREAAAEQGLAFVKKSEESYEALYAAHLYFMEAVELYGSEDIDRDELYSRCEKTRDEFNRLESGLDYAETDEQRAYLDTFKMAARNSIKAAQSLLKYLDSGEREVLYGADKYVAEAVAAFERIASKRERLLANNS